MDRIWENKDPFSSRPLFICYSPRPGGLKDPKFCETARALVLDVHWGWQTRVMKDKHGSAPRKGRRYRRVKLQLLGDSARV